METNKEYLARLLPQLKKEIPSQWRVQSFSKNKPIATVMSYIDQRDLMDVLDAYCEYGWEKNYEEVAGNVFCSIGIHMPDGTVHWRSDCGVESQSDAEKGRASDAAKRAGVNWGVGRFLYDKDIQYIETDGIKSDADRTEKKGEQTIVYKRFPSVVDKTGKKIWDLTAHINALNPNKPKAPQSVTEPVPPFVLTKELIEEYKEAIKLIKQATGLTGYYNALNPVAQQNEEIIQALKDQRTSLKK